MIGERWGVTDAEVERRYPCDDVVPVPALRAWRGVRVRAPADDVWPWLVQLRLAPYSYDWIDNLGRRSPQRRLDLPDPVVGDPFLASGGRPLGRVVSMDHAEQLTGAILGATMSYVLLEEGATTRLLLKIVTAPSRINRLTAPALALGDLVMARRQLLNLARLAEGRTS